MVDMRQRLSNGQVDPMDISKRQPDVVWHDWHNHSSPLLLDIAIDHPIATSHLSTYTSSVGDASGLVASKKESEKVSKYRSHVERRGFAFSPFGLETYGAWGPRAQGVLQRLVAHAESQSCDDTRSHYSWVASHIRDAAQQLVGVACARGIARALHESALGRVAPTNLDVGDYVERAFAGLHRRASSPPSSPPTRGRGGVPPWHKVLAFPLGVRLANPLHPLPL